MLCEGWKLHGECARASAFMLVHCPEPCERHELNCNRRPPADDNANCAAWRFASGCSRALITGARRPT